jgi:hypothetical protein
MNTDKQEDEFVTHDMGLSAYLLASGVPILGTSGDRNRTAFIFPSEARLLRSQYYYGATIQARLLVNAMKDIKSLLRNQ